MALDAAKALGRGLVAIWQFLLSVPGRIAAWRAMPPEEWAKWKSDTWATVKHEAHHYWVCVGSAAQGTGAEAGAATVHC